MALISYTKDLEGEEKIVFKRLQSLYRNCDHEVYIFHDIVYTPKYGKSFRPDFIILDSLRGISIIEVKGYKDSLLKIDETTLYFKNGKTTTSPFVQASDYRLKLFNYLSARSIEINQSYFKANLVFTKLKERIEGINGSFLNVFYKNDLKKFELDDIFPKIRIFFSDIQVVDLKKALNSTYYFSKPKSLIANTIEANISELDSKQVDAVNVSIGGHHLVKGVPGSGKSIAAVSRAIHVIKNHPDWKILVLCVNKKLKEQNMNALVERCKGLKELGLKLGQLTCKTLISFLEETHGCKVKESGYRKKLDSLTHEILNSEIRRVWDYIIVDEYQDFTAEHLEILKRVSILHRVVINKKERDTENLFFVGDQLQQLNGSIGTHSWKELGINITGRTIKLKHVYRSPSQIIDLALNYIIDSSKTMKKEVISYYEGIDDLITSNKYQAPVEFISGDDMNSLIQVKDWIQDFVGRGYSFKDLLIIHPDSLKIKDYIKSVFAEEIKAGANIGMPSNIKGIESKLVILWNIDAFRASFDTEKDKVKKIYMALTRGSKGLLIHSKDEFNEDYLRILRLTDDLLVNVA